MSQNRFEELAENSFISEEIKEFKNAQATINSISGWVAHWIVRNSKTFVNAFKNTDARDFEHIDLSPVLKKNSYHLIVTIHDLAHEDPEDIEILKITNRIKISYGQEEVRKVPFWLALPEGEFAEVIEFIKRAFNEYHTNETQHTADEETQILELLRDAAGKFSRGEISDDEFLNLNNMCVKTLATLGSAQCGDNDPSQYVSDETRDNTHLDHVQEGRVPEDFPFLSSEVRSMYARGDFLEPRRIIRVDGPVNDSPFL